MNPATCLAAVIFQIGRTPISCESARRAISSDAASGCAQPFHLPQRRTRSACDPGVHRILQPGTPLAGDTCHTPPVPRTDRQAAGRRQTDRPTRAWRRAARLSTRGLSRTSVHLPRAPRSKRTSVHSGPACPVFREFGAHLGPRNRHPRASFCEDRHLECLTRRRRSIFRGVRW